MAVAEASQAVPKTALVTGGAKRIGRALSLALVDAGYAVAIHAHHSVQEARGLQDAIRNKGGTACVVEGDLNDAHCGITLVEQANQQLGTLGVLVNNASLFEPDGVGTLEPVLWDQHFNINLRAPVFLAQAFAEQLPAQAQGVILNLVDQRVLKLTPQFMSYTLSKAALYTATTTLAQALAPRIRVVGIGPGPTLANTRQTENDFLAQCQTLPLQHGSCVDDITRTALFLIENTSITGQMIAVDGGQHINWQTADVANIPE